MYPLQSLPIDALHWSLALLPLIVLLVLLVGLRWQAQEAGPVGMFVAALIALFAFETPWDALAVASAKGIWDAIFILYVVWPALLLYHVIKRGGGFLALEEGIQRFSDNELFLVLSFGWVFASFMQGIAGFGTPIAVVAPLLLVLGVKPVYAVAIPLIGHAWANMFGTLAVGWLATLQVIDLQAELPTALETAVLLSVASLLGGVAIAWLYGRADAVRYGAPMILVVAAIHGVGQFAVMYWDPVLSAFLASTAALLALYPLSRWERYDQATDAIGERPAMEDGGGDASDEAAAEDGATADEASTDGAADEATADGAAGEATDDGATTGADGAGAAEGDADEADDEEPEPVMGFAMSLLPYVVLTVVAVVAIGIPQVEAVLERLELGVGYPTVETGYGVATEVEETYNPFTPLTHPGTFLLASVVVGWLVYRLQGYYDAWEDRSDDVTGIWEGLADDAVPASLAIVAFLVMAQVMEHAGQIEVLAVGTAAVLPPTIYAFASGWIGFLGAFMTSSNTSSNILLAPLQHEAVDAMEGLTEASIIGGQSAGGAVGNAIAPANVVLGTGTAGIVGREGDVLRVTIPWALLVMVLVGALTVALNALELFGGA